MFFMTWIWLRPQVSTEIFCKCSRIGAVRSPPNLLRGFLEPLSLSWGCCQNAGRLILHRLSDRIDISCSLLFRCSYYFAVCMVSWECSSFQHWISVLRFSPLHFCDVVLGTLGRVFSGSIEKGRSRSWGSKHVHSLLCYGRWKLWAENGGVVQILLWRWKQLLVREYPAGHVQAGQVLGSPVPI